MKSKYFIFVFACLLFFSFSPSVLASDYVLPYPSSMPGSFMYEPHLILDTIMKYWYFGDFGQFSYNLKESDRYLVEAKTLFEYNQYLLGYSSLQKSNEYFKKTLGFLNSAKRNGKNINENRLILSSAARKHIEVLKKTEKEIPESFNWQPEKAVSSFLDLKTLINASVSIREKYL